MISNEHKFIFVHIYKTAGTSVGNALAQRKSRAKRALERAWVSKGKSLNWRNAGLPRHAKATEYKRALGLDYERFFTFAFVRNPYDWHVSLFHHIKKSPKNPSFWLIENKTFEEFIHLRCQDDEIEKQTDFLVDASGRLIVDFIGRFESLHMSFEYICKECKLDAQLPHLNATSHGHYSKYYTKATRELVYRRFKRDFDCLGYSRDIDDASIKQCDFD